jgi:hypothetical protein
MRKRRSRWFEHVAGDSRVDEELYLCGFQLRLRQYGFPGCCAGGGGPGSDRPHSAFTNSGHEF